MLPTPDISHLKKQDLLNIYEPAEDTFALLDALEQDITAITRDKPLICVEVGSGSGIASAFAAQSTQCPMLTIATDINSFALAATGGTFKQNKLACPSVVHTSLLDGLDDRLTGQVDLLLFNPPYVETEEDERMESQVAEGGTAGIASAWAGGREGMGVTQGLLARVPRLLSPRGRFYLVAIRENHPERIIDDFNTAGLHMDAAIILRRRAGREYLHVIRVQKRPA